MADQQFQALCIFIRGQVQILTAGTTGYAGAVIKSYPRRNCQMVEEGEIKKLRLNVTAIITDILRMWG